MRLFLSLVVVALSASFAAAQATNDAFFSMTINGVDGMAPNALSILKPNTIEVTHSGTPNTSFLFAWAPTLNVGEATIGPIEVDIGPLASSQVIANGISPSNLFDFLANTGGIGTQSFFFPIGFQVNAGVFGAMQSVSADPTAPGGVADSAATELTIATPLDYGSLSYLRGTAVASTGPVGTTVLVGPTGLVTPSTDIDIDQLNMNYYGEMVANTLQSVYAHANPAIRGPQTVSDNTSFDHITTVHGNVYHFRDNTVTPNEFGFFIAQPGAAAPLEIPGSRRPNGTSTLTPFEDDVSISIDQGTMAVVHDPVTGNDQLLLMKLDGTVFPSTGTGVMDVTPAAAPVTIEETGTRIVGGQVYFTDSAASGTLYSAPINGSAIATPFVLPVLGTGNAATLVDDELFEDIANEVLFVQAGASTTEEDIFAISHPGGFPVVVNITNFLTPTTIDPFADAYDGLDGQVSVAPDGSKIAFVALEGGTEELYWVDVSGFGIPQRLSGPLTFDPTIDSWIELNFYDPNHIMAFGGTVTVNADLYDFDITGGTTFTVTNLTMTNGQNGATLPISATPIAQIDCDGCIFLPDRCLIARDGIQTLGASAGTSVFNLFGVDYATLTVYDIIGDEFSGGPVQIGNGLSSADFDISITDTIFGWCKSSIGTTASDEELISFDLSTIAPGMNHTLGGGTGAEIDNVTPDSVGTVCAFAYRVVSATSDEEVFIANFGVPGVTQVSADASMTSDISDGSIVHTAPGGPIGIVYARGTNNVTSPTDASLWAYDVFVGAESETDPAPAVYEITRISFP